MKKQISSLIAMLLLYGAPLAAESAAVPPPLPQPALKWEGNYETLTGDGEEDEAMLKGCAMITIRKDDDGYSADIEFRRKTDEFSLVCQLTDLSGKEDDGNSMHLYDGEGTELILLSRIVKKEKPTRNLRMNMARNTPGIFGLCEIDDDGKEFEPDIEFEQMFRDSVFEGMAFMVARKRPGYTPPPLIFKRRAADDGKKREWRKKRERYESADAPVQNGGSRLRKIYNAITGK